MNANGLIVLMSKFLPQMQEEIRKNKRGKKNARMNMKCLIVVMLKKKNSYLKSRVTSQFLCGGLKTLRL